MNNSKIKIGAITIGQSPRIDITEDIKDILGSKFDIVEKGALDSYEYKYIADNLYPSQGDTILVSRMRDGRQVKLSEEKILPLLQECIAELESMGCQAILMLCTGKFPEFEHNVMLIYPQKILQSIVNNLSDGNKIGVIIPHKDQEEAIRCWWKQSGVNIEVEAASPYEEGDDILSAAEAFKNKTVSLIFMDCMGYSVKMKNLVRNIANKPVLLARTLAARILRELFD